jgi:hypothetical protein
MIPKLYHNRGTANAPIAVILFLACNSDFSIILNLLMYSISSSSFVCWWTASFSAFPVQAVKFFSWCQVLHFASELIILSSIQFLCTCQVQIPYAYHWRNSTAAGCVQVLSLTRNSTAAGYVQVLSLTRNSTAAGYIQVLSLTRKQTGCSNQTRHLFNSLPTKLNTLFSPLL